MGAFITGGGANTQAIVRYDGIQIGTSQYNIPIQLWWGQRRVSFNLFWYNDFKSHPIDAKGKGGGKGQQRDYTAAVLCGLGEGIVDSIINVWQNGSTTTTTTLANLGFTFYNGSATQTPPSFITTKYPAQALSYALTSYMFNEKLDLGESATVPDDAFEALRLNGFTDTLTTAGWTNPTTMVNTPGVDVSLADVIPDFLTNVQYGMGFVSGDIPDLTQFRQYQDGQGLYFSPYLTSQEPANDIINRWAKAANTWIYWNGLQLQFVPLGDSAVGSYVPDLDASYDVTLADMVTEKGQPPIKITRKDPADCKNRLTVQFTDRTLGYAGNTSEYKDQTLVDEFGLRDASSEQIDDICAPSVAQIVSQLLGRREAYVRLNLEYTLNWRFVRVLPGTIMTVTDPNQGLNMFRVRVRTVEEDEKDGSFRIEAEELPALIGTFFPSSTQGTSVATFPNTNVDPGDVNTPAIFEPSSAFPGGAGQLLLAASWGPNAGSANVHVSFDNVSYAPIGTLTTPAMQGLLTAGFPSHADPDTTNTLSVNTAECNLTLQQVTNADADAFRTLSVLAAQPTVVGGVSVMPTNFELGAYGDVTSTGTFTDNLTYWRRGLYGSAPSAHSTGDQFTLVDVSLTNGSTIAYRLPASYIGGPIYIKFTTLNFANTNEQDLSSVVAYKYTPTGVSYGGGTGGVPTTPTGLSAVGGVEGISYSWNANAPTDNVTAYQLWLAAGTGVAFGSTSLVWSGLSLNQALGGLLPNQAYTAYLVAVNAVGSSSPEGPVNATTMDVSVQAGQATYSTYSIQTKPLNTVVARIPITFSCTLQSVAHGGFAEGKVDVAPGADTLFPVLKDGVSVAQAKWASGSTTPVLVNTADVNLVAGDYLDLQTPSNLNGMSGALGLALALVKG